MLVTFRVKDKTTRLHSEPAEISALELASLMRRLHAGHADIETESHEFSAAPLNFEVNANSLSLASFAACFDWRAEVIAIVEEAQFLGRTLRVHCPGGSSPITIMVSEHIALARDILLPTELAAKVARALGQGDGSEGEIPLDALRALLSDHHTAEAFRIAQIETVFESLSVLAYTDCGEQFPTMEWAS